MAEQHTFTIEFTNSTEKSVRAAMHATNQSGTVIEFWTDSKPVGSVANLGAGDLVASFNVKEVRGVTRSDVVVEPDGPSIG